MPLGAGLTRARLEAPGVRLLNRGGRLNPDVLLVRDEAGVPRVVKDYAPRSAPVRTLLAPGLIRRELRLLQRVAGLPGVPRPGGRVDRLALAIEYLEGVPLRRRRHRASLPRAFFDALEGILDGLALRGLIYTDLRSPTNVLCTATGAPALVDLGAAMRAPLLPRALVRRWEQRALRKLRRRFEGVGAGDPAQVAVDDTQDVRAGGVRFRLRDAGTWHDPVPALFLHDAGLSSAAFAPVLEAATRAGRRAIAVDLPGFGASGRPRGGLGPLGAARRLERLLAILRLGRVDLVGHAWGGLVARALAVRAPACVRAVLTLESPFASVDSELAARRELARHDPETLHERVLAAVSRDLPPSAVRELEEAVAVASRRALVRAYTEVPVRSPSRAEATSDVLDLEPPGQPWLCVMAAGEPSTSGEELGRSGSRAHVEVWTQPLSDPERLWKALQRLAGTSAVAVSASA